MQQKINNKKEKGIAWIMYNDENYDINEWFGGEILKDNRKEYILYHKDIIKEGRKKKLNIMIYIY